MCKKIYGSKTKLNILDEPTILELMVNAIQHPYDGGIFMLIVGDPREKVNQD